MVLEMNQGQGTILYLANHDSHQDESVRDAVQYVHPSLTWRNFTDLFLLVVLYKACKWFVDLLIIALVSCLTPSILHYLLVSPVDYLQWIYLLYVPFWPLVRPLPHVPWRGF